MRVCVCVCACVCVCMCVMDLLLLNLYWPNVINKPFCTNIDRIRQEQMTSAFTVKYSDTLKGNTIMFKSLWTFTAQVTSCNY